MTEFSFIDKLSFNWCLLATDNLTPSFWTVNHHAVIWRTRPWWPKSEKRMHPSISETNCLNYHQALQGNAKTALLFCYVTAQECRMAEGTGLAEGERGVESGGGRKLGKNARNAHVYPAFHWGGGSPPQRSVYKGSSAAAGESEHSKSSREKQQSLNSALLKLHTEAKL